MPENGWPSTPGGAVRELHLSTGYAQSPLDTQRLSPKLIQTFSLLIVLNISMEERFTSAEVVALTGITLRQLQWWDERGIVVPERQGHRRLYTMTNLTEVAVICELRRRGFPLQRVRKVMRFIQREFGKTLAQTVGGASEYHLLTDGKTIYLETSPREIVDILKNARQPMFAICLSDAVRQVRAEMRGLKKDCAGTPALRKKRAAS